MKNVSILGSTGSLGTQTLEVVGQYPDKFKVCALSANHNAELLVAQAKEFFPELVCIADTSLYQDVKSALKGLPVKVVAGVEGLDAVASIASADMVINNLVGSVGLVPTLVAIENKKTVGLANKESLVVGGELVIKAARDNGVSILPIDSEHSAILQCIGREQKALKRIILTASGGPFIDYSPEEMGFAGPEKALMHPNWKMGKKITIDSATFMNKGFEVIEAHFLFDLDVSNIDVLVHRQSIVHSMVEFIDGSILAQLAVADMRLPIQYAMTYPERMPSFIEPLNLAEMHTLTFEEPPVARFPCLVLAYHAIEMGGTMPTVLNAANETVVQGFLKGIIGFLDIPRIVEYVMGKHNNIINPTLQDILEVDRWARKVSAEYGKGL